MGVRKRGVARFRSLVVMTGVPDTLSLGSIPSESSSFFQLHTFRTYPLSIQQTSEKRVFQPDCVLHRRITILIFPRFLLYE